LDAVDLRGIRHVGKYKLLRELGRGGMGVVYLAEDTRLSREVALKLLHPALTLDTEFAARFADEARAIAALTHPGIVRVHAFEEVEGRHLIDMEYVNGRSLEQLLPRGAFPPADALGILAQVLAALAACHRRGMVHRDIKPSNILIAYDGRVLLSDFGLAMSCAHAASAATSSCFIGTPKYAPPESWEKAKPTPAGDVYSAGLVLLELLAGKTPFDGDSPIDIIRKTMAATDIPVREWLPHISGELAGLLGDFCARAPGRRPPDAGIALARLAETPEFTEVPSDGPATIQVDLPRTKRWGKPGLRWAAGAALVALALVGGLAWHRQSLPILEEAVALPVREAVLPAMAGEPGAPGIDPDVNHVHAVGNYVVFTANAGSWRTLWGHQPATGETKPLWPTLRLERDDGIYGAQPVSGGMVAAIRSETNGLTLFSTDGTPEGTFPLVYAASRVANRIERLGAQGGTAYFSRVGGDGTLGVWETDGTLAGTRHLWGDINNPTFDYACATPTGTLYVASRLAGSLDRFPGGNGPPQAIKIADAALIDVGEIFPLGESLLAVVDGERTGRELYMAEPGSDHLRLLYEFMPGPAHGLDSAQFAAYGGGAVFAAQTPEHGYEPWFTDGTPEGTRMLADVNPGVGGSNPFRFTESGGLLYFSAQTALHGRELWVSDGTTGGTRMVADFAPGVESGNPYALVPFQGGLLFTPHEAVHGEELWFTDGTPEGTRMIYEFVPGPEGGEPHGLVQVDDRVLFAARHPEHGRVLWETDGTPEGTVPRFETLEALPAPEPPPADWVRLGDEIIITIATPDYGAELWATDPATGESRLVRDIYPGPQGSTPRDFFPFDGQLFFVADDGIHGSELWRTDGTEAGTALAIDAFDGEGSGNPRFLTEWMDGHSFAFSALTNQGHRMFYYLRNLREFRLIQPPLHALANWEPIDLRPGPDNTIEFSVQNPYGKTTLWRTDGGLPLRIPALGTANSAP